MRLFLLFCFLARIFLSISVLCPLWPDPVPLNSSAFSSFANELDAEIKKIVDPASPGVSVSFVYDQAIIFSKGYGKINISVPHSATPTGDTGFRIGSLSKIFMVLWLLQLRDANKLNINDPVTKFLPDFSIINPFKTKRDITLRQLSCHMAGLAREAPCPGTYDDGCKLNFSQVYANIAKSSLIYPPGKMPSYSNMGFALLGRALEAFVKTPWEDWITNEIAKPMNLTNTGARFTPDSIKNLAVGYEDGKEAGLVDMGWEAPAGQMYSSRNDLSKLLMMIFRDDMAYGAIREQILDGETLREWMEPTYMNVDGTGFGLPWELYPIGEPVVNYTVKTKPGAINGYRAMLYFLSEIKTGFVLLQASENGVQLSLLTDLLVGFLFHVEWVLRQNQLGLNISDHPGDYVGKFGLTPHGELQLQFEVVEVENRKFLRGTWMDADKFDLVYQEPDVFMMTLHYIAHSCVSENEGSQQLIYFARSPSTKQVTSLQIPGREYNVTFYKIN